MIPNSLLHKWVSDEVHSANFLERKFLESEEERSRFRTHQHYEIAMRDAWLVLQGKLSRSRIVEHNVEERGIAERRLNARHQLDSDKGRLTEVEQQIRIAHQRLTDAQTRRSQLKQATDETMGHERQRWEDERRWMLRQLQSLQRPTTAGPDRDAQPSGAASPTTGDAGVATDVLAARTNAALARARQVLASS